MFSNKQIFFHSMYYSLQQVTSSQRLCVTDIGVSAHTRHVNFKKLLISIKLTGKLNKKFTYFHLLQKKKKKNTVPWQIRNTVSVYNLLGINIILQKADPQHVALH